MQIPLQSVFKALSFFKKKRDLIGIDIGTHSIKLVCLKGSPGQWTLVRWGVIAYGEDIPLDTPLMDRRPQAVAALQNYLRTADLPFKRVATSVSGEETPLDLPILDAASGCKPVARLVSLFASHCVLADALTKVVAVRGESSAPLLARCGAAALLCERSSGVWTRIGAQAC